MLSIGAERRMLLHSPRPTMLTSFLVGFGYTSLDSITEDAAFKFREHSDHAGEGSSRRGGHGGATGTGVVAHDTQKAAT